MKPVLTSWLENVSAEVDTPALVINEDYITEKMRHVDNIKNEVGCKVIYPLKPFTNKELMQKMLGHVDGFSASSLFEALFIKDLIQISLTSEEKRPTIHYVSPHVPQEVCDELCNFVTFNSLSQLIATPLNSRVSAGLRINPEQSYVDDPRYDPCALNTRLGVSLRQLQKAIEEMPRITESIKGIHFHNNCDSESFKPLLETVQGLLPQLTRMRSQLEWINLGGGYLLEDETDYEPLYQAVSTVKSQHCWDVYFEPGAALVRGSGFLIASVVDLIESSNGIPIAVLDTSVNHMPEVYEYQYKPEIMNEDSTGRYQYLLGGCSCLAGDMFGYYTFIEPLKLGTKIIFKDVGAYAFVKAHRFNGINLPSLYLWSNQEKLRLKKKFTYNDFLHSLGESNESI